MFPNPNQRINLDMDVREALTVMAEGNPGAVDILIRLFQAAPAADPRGAMGGFAPILMLDTLGIYGSPIYVLSADVCGRNVVRLMAVLRAVQLGLIPPATVQDAASRQDRSGTNLVPVLDLYKQVRARLSDFDVAGAANYTAEELDVI